MKFVSALLGLSSSLRERNLRPFLIITTVFLAMVTLYSTVFHAVMSWEGQNHSWFTSVYWTIVTMSTLGYGDIVFTSTVGHAFSLLVLLSGSLLILVLLPFTFIQFVFIPWIQRRDEQRTPRKVDERTRNHIIFTRLGTIEECFIAQLKHDKRPYVIIEESPQEAKLIHDKNLNVITGELDNPATYQAANINQAAMLFTSHSDPINSNICFTAQENLNQKHVNIVATAATNDSVDILELAGATHVMELGEILGSAFAKRIFSPAGTARKIYDKDNLRIAEATVASNKLHNKTVQESQVRHLTGCSIVGKWNHGKLETVNRDTTLHKGDIIILAGTQKQIGKFNKTYTQKSTSKNKRNPFVIILGAGRVGRALSKKLSEVELPHAIVDSSQTNLNKIHSNQTTKVHGDAADINTLNRANIHQATAVVVTTHDDSINIYLTLYVNQLLKNSEVEILSRAHIQRNTSTLYRAGADMVLSYSSMGSDALWKIFHPNSRILIAEGIEIFCRTVNPEWVGKTIRDLHSPADPDNIIIGYTDTKNKVCAVTADKLFLPQETLWFIGNNNQTP